MAISEEAAHVLRELNPWWADPAMVRPEPPLFVRPVIADLRERLRRRKGLIEVLRGPRQVGKTTGIFQIIRDLLKSGTSSRDVLFVRFDLELLREEPSALRNIFRWFLENVRERRTGTGIPPYVFLDEIHKVRRWSEEVKHLSDTYPMRLVLTGSSSVLVARGGRESLAGRAFSTELPTFTFREVLECWNHKTAALLPGRIRFQDAASGALVASARELEKIRPQQKLSLRRHLERYYQRGGYPRLHSGEVEEDRWADYLTQTIFENVLGADIPDLFPVRSPQLLRFLYLTIAKETGKEISQVTLTDLASAAGIQTNQVTVGQYLHYLADALLIREFRRYPLAKKTTARVPAKITLTDLGVRNAVLRGAPSIWKSEPTTVGPLAETLAQTVIRDHNLQVHFFRDYEDPRNRRSPVREVDFVAETVDGRVIPIEVKFRRRIDSDDLVGLREFQRRFDPPVSILVTRDQYDWNPRTRTLQLPLQSFLLAF